MDNFKLKNIVFKNYYYTKYIKGKKSENSDKLYIIYKIIKNLLKNNIQKYNIKDIIDKKLISILTVPSTDLNLEDFSDISFIISISKNIHRQLYTDLCYHTIIGTKFEYKGKLYWINNNFPVSYEKLPNDYRKNLYFNYYKTDNLYSNYYITLSPYKDLLTIDTVF